MAGGCILGAEAGILEKSIQFPVAIAKGSTCSHPEHRS